MSCLPSTHGLHPLTPPPPSQDDSGWTPLMIAASVKDSDRVVDLLLARGADVNQTSPYPSLPPLPTY